MILLISSVLANAQDSIPTHSDSLKAISVKNRNILTIELGRSDYFTYDSSPYKNVIVKYKKKLHNNRDINFFINYAKEKDVYFPYYDLIIKNPGGMFILTGLYLSSHRKYFAFNFGLISCIVRDPDPFEGSYYFVPIPTDGFSVGFINKLYVAFDSIDKELFKIPVVYSMTALFKISAISIHYCLDHPNMQFYAGISNNGTDEY